MTKAITPGTRIADKYRVVRTLGQGGMGVVYLAEHERLERKVAIKLLHAQLEQQGVAIKRFEREIKAMALVNNRHIAHALDADVQDDGSLFLVMEYLEGHNLRAELRLRRTIPFAEAAAYVMQACHGIAAMHDVGIVHRDLKPANLFLTELSGARCIKVLDFGIVKFLESKDNAVTEGDVALGTPLYMSPEQLRRPEEVSARSDVWALGVVLYELITGLSPFAASSPGAVVAAVMLDAPVSLTTLVPEVPEELARIVASALIKVPKFRIGSAREFAELLAPFALPTDAIRVTSSAPSQPRQRTVARVSVRPKLSAEIESKVDAFGEQHVRGDNPLDALRQLPSFSKLVVARGSDHMPTDRPAPGSVPERFDPPTLTAARPAVAPLQPAVAAIQPVVTPIQAQAQPEARSPSQRRSRRLKATGTLLLLVGLVLIALFSGALGSNTAVAARTAVRAPTSNAETAPEVARVVAPAVQPQQPLSEPSVPASSASTHAPSASSPPNRPKATTVSVRPPVPKPSASPVAPDGKPLHL